MLRLLLMLFLSGDSFIHNIVLQFIWRDPIVSEHLIFFILFGSLNINGWEMMISLGFLAAAR